MRRLLLWLLLFVSACASADDSLTWFRDGRLTDSGEQLLAQLARAEERGLRASDYDAAGLRARATRAIDASSAALKDADAERTSGAALKGVDAGRTSAAALKGVDAALTAVAARFASDLHQGRVKPSQVGYDLDIKRAPFDSAAAVRALASSSDVAATLDSMEPRLRHYALLKKALARYRALDAAHRDLVKLPPLPRPRVRPGESYVGAAALRMLLTAVGDAPAAVGAGPAALSNAPAAVGAGPAATRDAPAAVGNDTLDPALVDSLERFQSRHGLEADGVLGQATFRALTTPFSARVAQIELSLERVRWLPWPPTSPPIIVNIPQFRLFAFRTVEDSAQDILQMDVIVGDAFRARRTPVFAAEMRYIVLQPYWDVPRSILLKELLPDIRTRPGWIESHGFEIVRGQGDDARPLPPTAENIDLLASGALRLRQKPGAENALGKVKFMLPNAHNVYLHDTPARELFSRSRRALSHGCIRVSDPMALLAHVMRDDSSWTTKRRDRALDLSTPTRVPLSQPIPVFILYGTALATEAGTVLFFDDLYGQDAPLLAALRRTP